MATIPPKGILGCPVLGGHLKTDHRGSLQNRPMDITLDKNLFYLTGCLCGNPSFDLVRSDSGVGLECLVV